MLAAAAWIVGSDHLLRAAHDGPRFVDPATIKGLAFVLVTSALLHVLLRRGLRRFADAFAALEATETQRASLAGAQRRAMAIIQSTHDAVISTTADGTIATWNHAAEQMFGFMAEEVIGRPIERVIPSDDPELDASNRARVMQGEPIRRFETRRMTRQNEQRAVGVTCSPVYGPEDSDSSTHPPIVGVSEIVRDLSDREEARAEAERERTFASILMEALPGIVYCYDRQGRFLRWNRRFETVSGYAGDEIASMRPLDFFAGEDKDRVAGGIGAVFEHGESTVEAGFVARDGTSTPYFFTGRRTTFEGVACLVGVGVDISERKRAEGALVQVRERFKSTLESVLEACQILDFEWRYLYLNPAASQQNRRPNDELLGRTMQECWPGIEDTEAFALLQRSMQERTPVQKEVEFEFPDGSTGWFDLRSQPVPEGIFVLSIDISERHRAEAALRQLNRDLETRVAERTRELENAQRRAESADRLKSAFLATMSHELRTPLNSIIGFTGILRKELAGPLTLEQGKQLAMVHDSARHLLALINDVLDISKIEVDELAIGQEPFDLAASITRAVDLVRPSADAKELSLGVELDPRVETMCGDRRRVEQIILNLVNNAIKFTDRGSVTVRMRLVDGPPDPTVQIAVEDTGIGVPAGQMDLLFQPFRQLDTGLGRRFEGTGLGLAISSRLAKLMGGAIEARSEYGSGSTFTVTLPLQQVSPR